MSSTLIYYFSTTGNSLYVAKKLAESFQSSQLVNMAACKPRTPDFPVSRIGIVYPVYFWGVPRLVKNFLVQMEAYPDVPIFAVATNAGLAGDPHKTIDQILRKKSRKLLGGFLIWLPENFTPRYDAWPVKIQKWCFDLALKKICRTVQKIRSQEVATGCRKKRERSLFGINWLLGFCHRLLSQKLFAEKTLKPKNYLWADSRCNGCGICTKVCPCANVLLNQGKPVWGEDCEVCVACLQWCPAMAVQAGKATLKRKRYHHPLASLKDFILR